MISAPVPSNSVSFVRSHNCDAFITTKSFPGDSSKYLVTCPLSHPSDVLKPNWRRRDTLDGAMSPHPPKWNVSSFSFSKIQFYFISFLWERVSCPQAGLSLSSWEWLWTSDLLPSPPKSCNCRLWYSASVQTQTFVHVRASIPPTEILSQKFLVCLFDSGEDVEVSLGVGVYT